MTVLETSENLSFIAWLQAWQTTYNSRAKCRRAWEKSSRKTSACYFLIGALAPDTAEPWSDARTVIWRIPLVFVALEVPPLQEIWHEPEWTKRRALQLAAVSGHMTFWTSRCTLGKANSQIETTGICLHPWCCKPPPTRRHILDILLVCCMPDCHVHQHPPPLTA